MRSPSRRCVIAGTSLLSNARKRPTAVWWLYVIRCEREYLYVGISPDPLGRFLQHRAGRCRTTRMRRPIDLLASIPIGTYREASREEASLKRMSRDQKLDWAAMARQSLAWQKLTCRPRTGAN